MLLDGINALSVMNGTERFVGVNLLVFVLALRVHGEPSFFYAFFLGEKLADAPKGRCSKDTDYGRKDGILDKQSPHDADDADGQICCPGLCAPVVFCLDDDGMPDADGQEGGQGDDDSCEIHANILFLRCKDTAFYLFNGLFGEEIVPMALISVKDVQVYIPVDALYASAIAELPEGEVHVGLILAIASYPEEVFLLEVWRLVKIFVDELLVCIDDGTCLCGFLNDVQPDTHVPE